MPERPAPAPTQIGCEPKETRDISVDPAKMPAIGSCVHVRALAGFETIHHVDPSHHPDDDVQQSAYLYKDAKDFERWQGPTDHPPSFRIGLVWRIGIPAALIRRYPQFVEVRGRLVRCEKPDCAVAALVDRTGRFASSGACDDVGKSG